MSAWPLADLQSLRAPGDYTLVGGPFGSNLTTSDYVDSPGVPVIRGTNLDGKNCNFLDREFAYVSEEKAASLYRNHAFPGDIVFTQRGTLGQVAQIPETARFARYVISQSQMKLTVDLTKASPRFIYYYYRSERGRAYLARNTLATGVPHINLSILKRFPVPLPPLDEQRRIAAILDKADALRRKRQEAIALTEQLLRSTFLEMFGDPVTNPKGWPIRPLGELALVRGGIQVSAKKQGAPLSVPYLRVANVLRSRLDLSELKYMNVTHHELARSRLSEGDILIVEGHGNPGELGRGAIWDGSVESCVHQNHLIRVVTDRAQVSPQYACAFINSDGGRRHMLRVGKTTSGLNTLSTSNVKSVPVLLPPMSLQERFAALLARVRRRDSQLVDSAAASDTLFNALTQQAFTGQL